jgi:hypothetical protein
MSRKILVFSRDITTSLDGGSTADGPCFENGEHFFSPPFSSAARDARHTFRRGRETRVVSRLGGGFANLKRTATAGRLVRQRSRVAFRSAVTASAPISSR